MPDFVTVSALVGHLHPQAKHVFARTRTRDAGADNENIGRVDVAAIIRLGVWVWVRHCRRIVGSGKIEGICSLTSFKTQVAVRDAAPDAESAPP